MTKWAAAGAADRTCGVEVLALLPALLHNVVEIGKAGSSE
jgi:hypothetical protein